MNKNGLAYKKLGEIEIPGERVKDATEQGHGQLLLLF